MILVVSAVLFLARIDNTHLWDQDEGYYASVAAEMFARGDWIKPTFNGELFAHKPPMMYWGMMCGYKIFGVNEFGARFVSGLFGIGTVIVTYYFAKRMFGSTVGFYSSMAIASCLMFTVVSRSATADAHLTFWVTLSLSLWFRAYDRDANSKLRKDRLAQMRWIDWVGVYAAMAGAVLTKGPIGFLFPMAIIGMFLLTELHNELLATSDAKQSWSRHLWPYSPIPFAQTVWNMRPFTAMSVLGFVAGPWFVLVQWQSAGNFLNEFIGVHHLGRFSQAMDNHRGPVYYYVIACLVGMFPWSSFAIPIVGSWRAAGRSPNMRPFRLICCWVGVYFIIFSVAKTKLPNYILPAYPALAIITGHYFASWSFLRTPKSYVWRHAGWAVFVGLGLLLGLGGLLLGKMIPRLSNLSEKIALQSEHVELFDAIGWVGVPMITLGAVGWRLARRSRGGNAIFGKSIGSRGMFCIASVAMIATLAFWVAPKLDRFQASQRVAEVWIRELETRPNQVHAIGLFRPSLVFYFGSPVQFSDSMETALKILALDSSSIVVTTEKSLEPFRHSVPDQTRILQRMSQLPGQDAVLVLGHESLKR